MDRAGQVDKHLGGNNEDGKTQTEQNLNPNKLQHSCMHNLFHPVTRN